jgi:hypothetical protein
MNKYAGRMKQMNAHFAKKAALVQRADAHWKKARELHDAIMDALEPDVLEEVIQVGVWLPTNGDGHTFYRVLRTLTPSLKVLRKLGGNYNTRIRIPIPVPKEAGCYLDVEVQTAASGKSYWVYANPITNIGRRPPVAKILRAAKMRIDTDERERALERKMGQIERMMGKLRDRLKTTSTVLKALRETRAKRQK